MTDIPETTISRITHDEVLHKFWLGRLFAPHAYARSAKHSRGSKAKFTIAEIAAAVKAHGSQAKAAVALGISDTTVSYHLRKGVA